MKQLFQYVDYEETPIDQSYHPVLILEKVVKRIKVRPLGLKKIVTVRSKRFTSNVK